MPQQQIYGRLRIGIRGTLAEVETSQRVRVGEVVLQRFHESRCRDRSRDERDSNRLKWLRRKRFGRESSPEAMPVAGNGCKPGDPLPAHEIVDFAALNECAAMIAAAESCVTRSRPGFRQTGWQVLRVCTHVDSARRISPYFPGRGGGP